MRVNISDNLLRLGRVYKLLNSKFDLVLSRLLDNTFSVLLLLFDISIVEAGTVSVRLQGKENGDKGAMSPNDFIEFSQKLLEEEEGPS